MPNLPNCTLSIYAVDGYQLYLKILKRKEKEGKREKKSEERGTMGGTVAGEITKADANTTHKI